MMKSTIKEMPRIAPQHIAMTEVKLNGKTYEVSTINLNKVAGELFKFINDLAAITYGLKNDGFETMVFDRNSERPAADLYARSYSTREAAVKGHNEIVNELAAGKLTLDRDRKNIYDNK